MQMRTLTAGVVWCLGAAAASGQSASVQLQTQSGATCFSTPGISPVVVEILMTPGPATEIVGGQFFLQYDVSRLQLIGYVDPTATPGLVQPGDAPFTAQVFESVNSIAGTIDYAVGLPHPSPPAGATTPTVMARILFIAQSEVCSTAGLVWFRTPPAPFQTRLAARVGGLGDVPVVPSPILNLPAISIDATPPTITCPGAIGGQCLGDVPPANPAAVAAADSCDSSVAVTHVGDSSNGGAGCASSPLVITRIYRATDDCGNFSECTQTITIADTMPPSVTCPGPLGVQCASSIPAPDTGLVTATDNCGATPTISFVSDSSNGGAGCVSDPLIIIRTYRATDACGNFTDCTQAITAIDTINPTITCPTNLNLQCANAVPPPNFAGGAASDNCGVPTVAHMGDAGNGGTGCPANPLVIQRTYRATDECGNFSECTQTITVIDSTIPTITCPADVNIECIANVPPADFAGGSASDNCGPSPTVIHVGDVGNGGAGCASDPLIISRTYQATDDCGNANICVQTITVIDTTAPMFAGVPAGISLHADAGVCTATLAYAAFGVTASDNCDGPRPVSYERFDTGSSMWVALANPFAFPAGITAVRATAIDTCGNQGFSAPFNVTVSSSNVVTVYVELSPMLMADPSPALGDALMRCVQFDMYECGGGSFVTSATIAFSLDDGPNRGRGSATLLIPCGVYDCITAQDPLHTLTRRLESGAGFGVVGTTYTADFTTAARWLVQGDLFDDPGVDLIDILDFGVFVTEFPGPYDSDGDTIPDGNTDCSTLYPHADLDGDGIVFGSDYTFITNNFLEIGDAACCAAPVEGHPVADISVAALRARGLGRLVIADLNRDGRLNTADIAAFANGARPRPLVEADPTGGESDAGGDEESSVVRPDAVGPGGMHRPRRP